MKRALLFVGVLSGCTETAPIRTDKERYALALGSDIVLSTDITIHFRNTTPDTLYIVNCNGALQPSLERRTETGWVVWLDAASNSCLSPPIKIAPNQELIAALPIRGSLPGTDAGPAWRGADLAGEYRIVMNQVVGHYDPARPGFGAAVPAERRSSNSFRLDAPPGH